MGTLGSLSLIMAASGALLVVLRVTETFGRGSIFWHSTSCFVEGMLWSLPSYAAMLAIVTTTALMAVTLVRERVGPPPVRMATRTFAPTLWTLSLMLTGVSIALISLLLLPLRVPLPLVVLGWTTGVALAVYVPLTTLWREIWMSTPALTAELLALTVWALLLGIVLRRPSAATA